ncbi:MAG: TRAP transporter substrate-binding protein [Eubacterium sp.]
MKKRLICMILVCCLVVGILSGCTQKQKVTESGEPVITIRLAHDNNINTAVHKSFVKFKEEVEKESNGRIQIILFPSAQMGSVTDTFEQARRGDIEMSASATSNFTSSIPEFSIWESYYLFDDSEHAARVLDGAAGKKMMEPLNDQNLDGIGYMEIGFRNFSNSKRPINEVKDLQNLKIRGYNPLQIKAWEALGVTMSAISWNELYTSLQQNLIDGQECATQSFYTEKFYETQKYWSLTKHVYTNFLWYANKDFMNSLSENDRALVLKAAKNSIDYNRKLVADSENETLQKIKDAGVLINEVPIETRHEMGKKMNAAVKDNIVKQCGQDIYDFVMNEIDKERKSAE